MAMLRLFVVLSLICGVLYPLAVTGLAQGLFYHQSQGSLLYRDGHMVGSELLAQKFTSPQYFWPRPSAADFATIPSAASQASPTHQKAREQRQALAASTPMAGVDAWTTSGSGLDPHITPATALAQVERIAAARGMSSSALTQLIAQHTEGETMGIWGRPRVNVLTLNLSLDRSMSTQVLDGH